jgi:hypothetical protein
MQSDEMRETRENIRQNIISKENIKSERKKRKSEGAICMCVNTYVYVCIYKCIYKYICIYIYIYINK